MQGVVATVSFACVGDIHLKWEGLTRRQVLGIGVHLHANIVGFAGDNRCGDRSRDLIVI